MANKAVDTDAVYQQAVRKLRTLLSASEGVVNSSSSFNMGEQSLMEEEEEYEDDEYFLPFAGSLEQLSSQQQQPQQKSRFLKNKSGGGGGSRTRTLEGRERHNSWHNLVHLAENSVAPPASSEELSLVQRQESYIRQLERETTFCREQLSFVLHNVKDVLDEKQAVVKSEEVNHAIASVFGTVQGWQRRQQEEEAVVMQQAVGLKDANKALKMELERLKAREDEAAEQVKRSLQVAEQLRMEKSEYEFEVGQLRLQIDRQQGKIRGLIEEQDSKVEEERAHAEKRCKELVASAREEAARQVEEVGRLTSEVDRLQRLQSEQSRQQQEKERIASGARQDAEKKLGQLQLEMVRLNSHRQELETENGDLRVSLEHVRHEFEAETARRDAELKSLKTRLAKAEEALLTNRQELLDMTEEKAALDQEVTAYRLRNGKRETSQQEAKLGDLVKRQSRIIGELRQQCSLVTDRLEMAATSHSEEKRVLRLRIESLEGDRQRCAALEAQLEERGRLHQRLCARLEQVDRSHGKMDRELRQARLDCEGMRQEKSAAEHEVLFYRDLLKSRGLLPERDVQQQQDKKRMMKHAIIIERDGEVFSPISK